MKLCIKQCNFFNNSSIQKTKCIGMDIKNLHEYKQKQKLEKKKVFCVD